MGIFEALFCDILGRIAPRNRAGTLLSTRSRNHEEKSKPPKTTNTPVPKRRSQDQFFKNRDRNGDGMITLQEYIGNPKGRNVPALTRRFKKIDANGDGKLQLDELKKQTK